VNKPGTNRLIVKQKSRTRRRQYNSVGQLTADIDATGRKVEYAYNIHGERLGTRNARGTVFFDHYDRNGSIRFHGILRTLGPGGGGEYNSFTGPRRRKLARRYLNAYLYDQANRRFASKTFTEGADAPWTYTWLDGRNFGILQRDAMGVVTQCRYDQFGNKAVEIDGAGAPAEWNAATADYDVGRIETYRQPADIGTRFGSYTYNRFGELKVNMVGNTRTEYDRCENGLVGTVTVTPNVSAPNAQEKTTYFYDARGQLTQENRIEVGSSSTLQAKYISYDTQGRLAHVQDDNSFPAKPGCYVSYAYDEWSNVRRIQSAYTHPGMDEPGAGDSWYEYDDAGRMTISNGVLVNGIIRIKRHTPGSVRIGYDSVGRRSSTTEYVRHGTQSLPTMLRTWDTMRDERYTYNDLGHLRRIEQRIRHVNIVFEIQGGTGEPQPDRVGNWQPLSRRTANLRGDVTTAEQWARISGKLNNIQVDQVPARLGTTTTSYRPDGQVSSTNADAVDPKNSTETQNTYNAQTGQLDSYVFKAFRSDGVPFTTTFEYRHTFQNGQRVVRRIRDVANGMDTTKTYDLLGRLGSERVDLQRPNGTGSDRYEERFYEYGADGRVIFKDARLRLSASGPVCDRPGERDCTVPLPTPSTGQQTYVYAGARMAATVGAQRLAGATKFDFAYTPMSEAAGSRASRYVVQSGQSLIDIAQANYGDGALWYVIADANGIVAEPGDPLPTTEVGKAYEIPEVVRSTHSASTFKPYQMAEIIGNDRPIAIPPPPPPKYSDIEHMAVAAASITLQVGATIGLSMLGVPVPMSSALGAGLSNLAGQATSWELGMRAPGQNRIDWGGVGIAAMEGYMFSVAGPAGALSRELSQQGRSGFSAWTSGPGVNWSGVGSSLFNIGVDALRLSGTVGSFNAAVPGDRRNDINVGGLITSAFNPSSGWAMPSSRRSPTVGMFEYLYSTVANGLVNHGFAWIREQLNTPSAPAVAPRPRSVDDPRGPLPAETIDVFDEIDRWQIEKEDREALAARNEQIALESDKRLWQLELNAMQDRIEHIADNDRAIISSTLRHQQVQRGKAAADARARDEKRMSRLKANEKRFDAVMRRRFGPSSGEYDSLREYGREMDELNNEILRGMYAQGMYVPITSYVNVGGLTVERSNWLYDKVTSPDYTLPGGRTASMRNCVPCGRTFPEPRSSRFGTCKPRRRWRVVQVWRRSRPTTSSGRRMSRGMVPARAPRRST
jgi:YD repeat-containing protein